MVWLEVPMLLKYFIISKLDTSIYPDAETSNQLGHHIVPGESKYSLTCCIFIHNESQSVTLGQWREKIPVRNPRTGKEDYYIPPPTQTRLAEECARIRKHQVAWAKAPISYRVEVLLRWANAIEANRKSAC